MLISMKFKNIFVSLILSAVFCTNAFAYDGVNLNIMVKTLLQRLHLDLLMKELWFLSEQF